MERPALIDALRRFDAALRENGATGVFLFGSRARGTHLPDSDIDLFIDYDPAERVPNIFRLMQLEDEISEALGVGVTITTRSALHPLMRGNIERDAVRVL
jgi:predicted nucleotidyltransferase